MQHRPRTINPFPKSPAKSAPPGHSTHLPKMPVSKCTLRITLLLCTLLIYPAYTLNLFQIQERISSLLPSTRQTPDVRCVKPMGSVTANTIAEFVSYHQLALFIANLHLTLVAFPPLGGPHGNFVRGFGNCLPPNRACMIRQKQMPDFHCPLGDCTCLAAKVSEYVNPRKACPVLGVVNNGIRNREFSGCLGNILRRYFTIPSRWPRPYDLVQFIDGSIKPDFATLANGLAYTKDRFESLMHAMCIMSDRDIIVVIDEDADAPSIPLCENRTVLARISPEEMMMISPHARHLSVSGEATGKLMMEMTLAERVILLTEVQKWFLWQRKADITLVRKDGVLFNFTGGELERDIERELEKVDVEVKYESILHGPGVPSRRWEDEAVDF